MKLFFTKKLVNSKSEQRKKSFGKVFKLMRLKIDVKLMDGIGTERMNEGLD